MGARHLVRAIAPIVLWGTLSTITGDARAEASDDAPDIDDRVAALPELARLEGGRTLVVVRGDLPRRQARRMVRLARDVYDDVDQRFVAGPDDGLAERVDLCLFASSREYEAFVTEVFGPGDHSGMGFYVPSRRIVVANLARSVGNLRHEVVHPLLGDDFPGIPAWLNEGMASLYGTATRSPGPRGRFRFLVNYRLRHFRRALSRGELPTLEELARSTYDDVHGDRVAAYYAMGRYLALYLDRRGQLDRFYRAMRAEELTAERQLAVLRAYFDYDEFLAWSRRLRIPPRKRRDR